MEVIHPDSGSTARNSCIRAPTRAPLAAVRWTKACEYASAAQERSLVVTVHPWERKACATRVVPVKTSRMRLGAPAGRCSWTKAKIFSTRDALLPMYFTPYVFISLTGVEAFREVKFIVGNE